MTDNDISKALEYCSKQGITSECEKCKVKKGCRAELIAKALDLINRQKAEIERLREENEIKSQKRANIFEIVNAYDKGRFKAVLEFNGKLKLLIIDIPQKDLRYANVFECIDKIFDEMVGDAENG